MLGRRIGKLSVPEAPVPEGAEAELYRQTWIGYPSFDPQGNLYLLAGKADGTHALKVPLKTSPDTYSVADARDLGLVPGMEAGRGLAIGGISTGWDIFTNRLLVTLPIYPNGQVIAIDPITGKSSTVESVEKGYFYAPMISDVRR